MCLPAASVQLPEPTAIYARMARTMSGQPRPNALSYDEIVKPQGLGIRIVEDSNGAAVHVAFSSQGTPQVFHVTHDAAGTQIVDVSNGQHYASAEPFWSPLWVAPSSPSASVASPATNATVLAVVRERALSDLLDGAAPYRLTLAGIESVGREPAYHLRLAASDQNAHPLTDLYIDERSLLVRRAVAAFTDHTVATVTGVLTFDFARTDGYWMVASGSVEATLHAYFRKVSGSATFAASNVTLPSS